MGGRFIFDYLGGLNLFQGIVNLARSAMAGDMEGHTIALPRYEFDDVRNSTGYTGSHWNMRMVMDTLTPYRVAVIAYGFDESSTWCKVPLRQARFAEYLLARAGAPVQMATVDERNAAWAAKPAHNGQMPPRWDDRERHTAPTWAERDG